MKKILFMLTDMNVGGTEKALLNLLGTFSPQEYEVTLLLLQRRGGFLNDVPKWVRVCTVENYDTIKPLIMDPPLQLVRKALRKRQISQALIIAFWHLICKATGYRNAYYRYVLRFTPDLVEQYDIAVAFAGPFDFLSVYILEKVSANEKIQWVHFDVDKFYVNPPNMRESYPRYDRIYAVSEEAREHLVHMVPAIADKTYTRYNVVDTDVCYKQAERGVGFTDGWSGLRILTVGRLAREKGQDIIPAVALILQQRGLDFRWYLIGDGELREQIESDTQELGVRNRVVLLGTQTNPYPFYRDADFYVQTSLHEGYCITLAEARAFGLPVVSTSFVGAHEQLNNRPQSAVVDRNAKAIADAVESIWRAKENGNA